MCDDTQQLEFVFPERPIENIREEIATLNLYIKNKITFDELIQWYKQNEWN